MSITFSVVNGPTKLVQDYDYDGNPEFNPDGTPVMYEDDIHTLNVSNRNADLMLSSLGLAEISNGCGKFPFDQLPEIRRRILLALNGSTDFSVPTSEVGRKLKLLLNKDNVASVGFGGPRIVECGITDEGVRQRLTVLLNIVVAAQELNSYVVFG